MIKDAGYFHINIDFLLPKYTFFPFSIHVYSLSAKSYSLFLKGNNPLDPPKRNELQKIIEEGGIVSISINQKKTFINFLGLNESDIFSQDEIEEKPSEFEIKREEKLKELRENQLNSEMNSNSNNTSVLSHQNDATVVNSSIQKDDFLPLIESIREEVLCFSLYISQSVSFAVGLADKAFNVDNCTNRITAVSYMMAKVMGMKSEQDLADIFLASQLHHIGFTQIEKSLSRKAYLDLNDQESKEYKNHPGLTQHLTRKLGLHVNDRIIKIILEHHEREDGCGFPSRKMGANLEPLSQVLGVVSMAFEYAEGKVTGVKKPINTVCSTISSGGTIPGLELNFNQTIYNNFISLMTLNIKDKVA
ncbi:MAG: hypothetical protein HOE90_07700 [Bacteriovoracaceae bacterium]|mgnify:CR=1 FL=1|jgi:HD-GYP domain-containing protein (c-di-GMP phosphodiesterase class II)|nr:hypothetical protein [Bacteriovoracaceae bacterium]